MRRRRHTYRVRYIMDGQILHCNVTTTSVEQVHLHMDADYPDSDVQVIYKLEQVWGKG